MTPRALRLRPAVPAVALIAALVLPVLWWLKVAFVDPETEMLTHSACGDWVVHPEWNLEFESIERPGQAPLVRETSPPVAYRLDIPAEALVSGPVAEMTVMGAFQVTLGNRPCGSFAADRGWRRPVEIDLGACVGSSTPSAALVIRAQNEGGPAPARVCWKGAGAALPATGGDGWFALTAEAGWRPAALAGRGMSELSGKDFAWPSGPWGYRMLLALLVLLALVGLFRASGTGGTATESRRRGDLASGLVLVLAFSVYAWNASVYPWWTSRIDQGAHAERIREAAEGLWLPSADRSFQSYQPPLYYAAAGSLAALSRPGVDLTESAHGEDLRPAQWLDASAGAGHLLLAFWMLRRFGPTSPRARALSLAVVGLAPVAVTTYPMLGNETLGACLCGAALVAGLSWTICRQPDERRSAVLWAAMAGAVAALALLTKFTGLMPIAAIALVLGARHASSPSVDPVQRGEDGSQRWPVALAWLGAIVALAGPFFAGRWARWGNPFIGNWDRALGFGWEGEPGYRTVGFFLRFGEVFFHSPERGMWSSFWDGLYASTWAEINDSFVPVGDSAVDTLQLLVMAFAVVPTLAALAGFVVTARRAWTRPPGLDLTMVAVSVFTLSSVAVYTTRVPFANTVKAIFLLSLLVPAALFVARGYSRMERGLGRACWLLDVVTVLHLLLVLRLFVWMP